MNFIMSLVHIRASLSPVIEYHSAESEGPRCNSSWGLRIFFHLTLVTNNKMSFSKIGSSFKIYLSKGKGEKLK